MTALSNNAESRLAFALMTEREELVKTVKPEEITPELAAKILDVLGTMISERHAIRVEWAQFEEKVREAVRSMRGHADQLERALRFDVDHDERYSR